MAESPNWMYISSPSAHPITDSFGNAWRITQTKQVSANGVLDNDRTTIIQMAYVNQMIWRQREDLLWQCKKHLGDPWLPDNGTSMSPIPDWPGHAVDEDQRGMREILVAIAALRADLDANKGTGGGGGGITPAQVAQILASLDKQQAEVTGLLAALQADVTALMAAIKTNAPPPPVRILLDLEHGTHRKQAIPSATGP